MGAEDFLKIVNNVRNADGKIVGKESEFIKTDLASTDKQAWVKHLVEQYLKKEKMDVPPEKYAITKKDFVREIARREIKKMFGRG